MEFNKFKKINAIMRRIPKCKDHNNVYSIKNGKVYMNQHVKYEQFPSYINIRFDLTGSDLYKKNGSRSNKGLAWDEFISELNNVNVELDSGKIFPYESNIKVENSSLEGNSLIINNEVISNNEVTQEILFDNNDDIISEFLFTDNDINKMLEFDKKPYIIIFDFNTNKVMILDSTDNIETDSFLSIRIGNKFIPTIKNDCELSARIYKTECEYIYDVLFTIRHKNKKGIYDPIIIDAGIRILEV